MTLTIPDAHSIFRHIESLIKTVPSFGPGRVFTGYVPETVPAVGGHILPYCALWPSGGTSAGEEPVGGGPDLQGQAFRFMTTVAGAEPWAVLGATSQLKATLTGARVGSGIIRPVPDQQRSVVLLTDRDVAPARPYLPLAWTLQTSRNPEP